jgi:hypothetical protein
MRSVAAPSGPSWAGVGLIDIHRRSTELAARDVPHIQARVATPPPRWNLRLYRRNPRRRAHADTDTSEVVWWLSRPLWLLILALLTVGLIAVFRRFDSSRPILGTMRAPREADVLTALGASLAALAVLMVAVTGIDVLGSTVVRFVVVDIRPGVALATLAAGTVVLALGRSIGVTPRARGEVRPPADDPDRFVGTSSP